MSKTVLVTGGAGSIGSWVVEKLIGRGDKVVAVDNFNNYYSPTLKRKNIESLMGNSRFELVEEDIRSEGVFENIFDNFEVDVVVHLAARAGVRKSLEAPQLYYDVNVMGSLNLLEAMRKRGVMQLVFASSSSVYGDRGSGAFGESDNTNRAISPYAASKKALEVMAHSYSHLYGIQTSGLRFFTAYGPRNRPDMACYLFVDAVSKGKTITRFGDGSSGRDYTYVEDIAGGVLAAIDRPFGYEIFNLGNSSPVKLNELIEKIENVVGKKAVIEEKPMAQGDVEFTFADVSKAKEMLNWEPKVKLDEGLVKLYEWYESVEIAI